MWLVLTERKIKFGSTMSNYNLNFKLNAFNLIQIKAFNYVSLNFICDMFELLIKIFYEHNFTSLGGDTNQSWLTLEKLDRISLG